MALVLIIDVVVVGWLLLVGLTKGLERTLPFLAFVMVVVPDASEIPLPGLFDLTTQRIALVTVAVLFLIFGSPKSSNGSLPYSTPLKFLMAVQVVWCVISNFNSIVPLDSFKKMVSQVVEYYLFYYIVFRSVSSEETVRRILFAMVSGVFLCCVFGFVESYFQWTVMDYFPAGPRLAYDELGRGLRARSTCPIWRQAWRPRPK